MDECEINFEKGETEENNNFDSIVITQNNINYYLNIETKDDKIIFSINDQEKFPSVNYSKEMILNEIKELNNVFNEINSFYNFYDYLKQLSNSNNLNIKKSNDKIILLLNIEVQQVIEIDLYPIKEHINLINLSIKKICQELFNMKNKIIDMEIIKTDNNNLKNKLNNMDKEMNTIKNDNSNLKNKLDSMNKEMNTIKIENDNLKNKSDKTNNEMNIIKIDNDNLKNKLDKTNNEYNIIKIENNNLKNKLDNMIKEMNAIKIENNNLKNGFDSMMKEINIIKTDNSNLKNKLNKTNNEMDIIKTENKKLLNEIDSLKLDKNKLKNEINNIKFENNELKLKIEEQNKEIKYLKNIVKYIDKNKSIIVKENEKDMIYKEIENKMNKKIKEIKKLYQATIDGGDPINFHKKCDNIPNTLVLIKSEGYRRFGGFTPIPWKSDGDWSRDPQKKTFVFSLDNKKIYYLNNFDKAVYHEKICGPCFGFGYDIGIEGNPIIDSALYTCQSMSYDYKGDKNCLSEYKDKYLKAIDYEVFQIIFF